MKSIMKAVICVALALAMLLSATACTLSGVADEVRNNSSDRAEDSTGNNSINGESLAVLSDMGKYTAVKADTATRTDASNNDVIDIPVDNAGNRVEESILIKESIEDFLYTATEWNIEVTEQDAFALAAESVAFDLYSADFDVFKAFVMVDEVIIPGLAYTKYEIYSNDETTTVYSCGFVQLIEGSETEAVITREMVENGLIVIPYGTYDTNSSFVLNMGASIESYSFILDDYYTRYDQIADYAVSISVEENDRSLWDENIDLFNYDEERYVFKGDMSYKSVNASPYFSDEAKAYAAAREAVEKIVEYQESNAYKVEKQVIILFTEDALEEYILNTQQGSINGFLLEQINNLEVQENQFVVITTEGVHIETVVDTDALAKERMTNGIIGFIGSALLVTGSIFITVATCGAGAPLAISAICVAAGTGATLYGVSQLVEAGLEIYYGATGDVTSASYNPLLEAFKAVIPDDELATKVYHTFGISCSLVQTLIVPANAAIGLSKAAGATAWQTTLAVGRAVIVETAKIAITGAVAAGIGYGTTILVTDLTGSENWGKIAGFGSTLLAGMFTYKGLNKIDTHFNFSGLYSKTALKPQTQKDFIEELKQSGEKFTEEDIIFIDKDPSGKIIWLEKGNQKAGLEHILHGNPEKGTTGHEADFLRAFGITKDQLPAFLRNTIKTGKYTVQGNTRIYSIPNSKHPLYIVVSSNGFVVTAFPG